MKVLLLLVVCLFGLLGCDRPESEKVEVVFKDNIEIQLDKDVNTCQFVHSINGKEVSSTDIDGNTINIQNYTLECPEVETKKDGSVSLEYSIGNEKYYASGIIKDLIPPNIELKTENFEINEGEDFDILKMVEVTDNLTKSEDIIVSYAGDYKTSTTGVYEIKIMAVDTHSNIGYTTLVLNVLENDINIEQSGSNNSTSSPNKPTVPSKPSIPNTSNSNENKPTYKPQTPSTSGYSKDFLFKDGYDMNTSFTACSSELSGKAGTCIPLQDENGIYLGYRLNIN